MRLPLLLCLALVLVSRTSTVAGEDDILQQKEELLKIQKEVDQSQKRLDSLKRQESSVQNKIAEYDQKIATNKKLIERLNREHRQLKSTIREAEGQLATREDQYNYAKRRYLGSLRQFYMSTRVINSDFVGHPDHEIERDRQIVYLTAVANFESDNVSQAYTYLTDAVETKASLVKESQKVVSLRKEKETSTALEATRKQRTQSELEKVQRRKIAVVDHVLTLQQAAREMEEIIERLERDRQRAEARQKSPDESVFTTLKGKLLAPFRGKIVQRYGEIVDPITNLRSFSPGIVIKGKPGGPVSAVSSGTIAYVGNLRGYGNFVIINHDDIYYTTYAGLGATLVSEGQYVRSGTKLASSADDGQVRFELRQGSRTLDPVKWVRLDTF